MIASFFDVGLSSLHKVFLFFVSVMGLVTYFSGCVCGSFDILSNNVIVIATQHFPKYLLADRSRLTEKRSVHLPLGDRTHYIQHDWTL